MFFKINLSIGRLSFLIKEDIASPLDEEGMKSCIMPHPFNLPCSKRHSCLFCGLGYKFERFFLCERTKRIGIKNVEEWRIDDTLMAQLIQGSKRSRNIGNSAFCCVRTQEG